MAYPPARSWRVAAAANPNNLLVLSGRCVLLGLHWFNDAGAPASYLYLRDATSDAGEIRFESKLTGGGAEAVNFGFGLLFENGLYVGTSGAGGSPGWQVYFLPEQLVAENVWSALIPGRALDLTAADIDLGVFNPRGE